MAIVLANQQFPGLRASSRRPNDSLPARPLINLGSSSCIMGAEGEGAQAEARGVCNMPPGFESSLHQAASAALNSNPFGDRDYDDVPL